MKQVTTISVAQEQLLDALTALGAGWHDRAALAEQLDKIRLNSVEIAALELLAVDGLIDMEAQPGRRAGAQKFVYRLKPGK